MPYPAGTLIHCAPYLCYHVNRRWPCQPVQSIPLWSIYLLAGLEQFQLGLIGSQAVAVLLQGPEQVVTVSSDAGGTTLRSAAIPTCTSQGDGARAGFRTSELLITTQSRQNKEPQDRA